MSLVTAVPPLRPIRRPDTTTTHQTGKKNSVRIPASAGSVCSNHRTMPTGANNPIAPPARLVVSTISFREGIGRNSVKYTFSRTDSPNRIEHAD